MVMVGGPPLPHLPQAVAMHEHPAIIVSGGMLILKTTAGLCSRKRM